MPVFPLKILQEHTPKPLNGQACNNCGLCCRVQACHVSKHILHSDAAPCIALEVQDGKYLCGLLRRPAHYLPEFEGREELARAVIGKLLDIGGGCGMPDEALAMNQEAYERWVNEP